jgi:hypothetical protein
MKALKLLFQFLILKNLDQVHKILAIMLDPWFKSLQIVRDVVGRGDVI